MNISWFSSPHLVRLLQMRPWVPEGGSRTCCWSWTPWLDIQGEIRGIRNLTLYFPWFISIRGEKNSSPAWRWCDSSSLKMPGSAGWREYWEKVSSVLTARPPSPPPPPWPRSPLWRTRRGWRAASSLPRSERREDQRPDGKHWGVPEHQHISTHCS